MESRNGWLTFLFAAAVVLALPATAAPIINGRFETGNFTGWGASPSSDTSFAGVIDSAFGVTLQGDHSALVVARAGSCGFPGLPDPWCALERYEENFPYGYSPTGSATYGFSWEDLNDYYYGSHPPFWRPGGAIAQDFVAQAGDTLTVEWRWITNDSFPQKDGDNAVLVVSNGVTQVGVLASVVRGMVVPAPSETGFRSIHYLADAELVLPTPGLWTLHIQVGHGMEDNLWSSAVLVDNVRLRSVPEPSLLALLSLGLAGLAVTRRRKQ